MDISKNLLKLRKNLGLSQEELAEKLSISRQAVGKWETGQAFPEPYKLIQLSDLFKTSIDRLIRDTYLGGEKFSGEEAVWREEKPIWCMNYTGRVISESFSGDFLKAALALVPKENPYRGPMIYKDGSYSYHCKVDGCFSWYQGYEEIFFESQKIYECYFHGGIVV